MGTSVNHHWIVRQETDSTGQDSWYNRTEAEAEEEEDEEEEKEEEEE